MQNQHSRWVLTLVERLEWGPLELLVCLLSIFRRSSSTALQSHCRRLLCPICPDAPNLRISRALIFTFCVPNEALCAVVSQAKSRTDIWVHSVSRFCGDSSCQHLFAERDKLLRRLLSVHPLKWRLPVATLLASGQDASGVLHQTCFKFCCLSFFQIFQLLIHPSRCSPPCQV